MDLNDLALSGEAFYQFLHPTKGYPLFDQKEELIDPNKADSGTHWVDDPEKPVGVWIVGGDTKEFKAHLKRVADMNADLASKRRGKRMSSDEQEREAMKTLAACIKRFSNVSEGDRQLEAPGDALYFVSQEKWGWASEQIDRAIQDRGNFLKGSAKS